MPRITLDIDSSVLVELKRRALVEGRSIGQVASELLAAALGSPATAPAPELRWIAKPMHARVDLEDKEQLRRAVE